MRLPGIAIGLSWQRGGAAVYSVTLPQKLIVTPDVYTEEMDATTGWTLIAGASMDLNITEFHSGTGSIKLTSASGAAAQMKKTLSWDMTADSGRSIRLWIYPHSAIPTTISYIRLSAFKNSEEFSHVFNMQFQVLNPSWPTVPLLKQNEWNVLYADYGNFTAGWVVGGGTPNWNRVDTLRINVGGVAGGTSICSFDLINEGIVRKPAVIMTFDDNWLSQYTKAYPLFKAKKMVASCFVVSDYIGQGFAITPTQLQELNANGWDICNHTKDHTDLSTLTQQQVIDKWTDCKTVLDGLGLTRASNHTGFPGGIYNETVIAGTVDFGAKSGRTGDRLLNILEYSSNYQYGFPLEMKCAIIANATSLATIQEYLETIVLYKSVGIFVLHDLVDSGATGTQVNISKLSDVLELIESLGLQTLTINEFHRLYSGPITVNHK